MLVIGHGRYSRFFSASPGPEDSCPQRHPPHPRFVGVPGRFCPWRRPDAGQRPWPLQPAAALYVPSSIAEEEARVEEVVGPVCAAKL